MKKTEIRIGAVYAAKVGTNVTGVRIMKESVHGGWDGINVNTNKPIRIKSPSRLRGLWNPKAPNKIQELGAPAAAQASRTAEESAAAKAAQVPEAAKAPEPKCSGLNMAAKVLEEAGSPLNCQQMVKAMLEKGYWKTNGKTPSATLYSAIIREIKIKGQQSRFRKSARGSFELAK